MRSAERPGCVLEESVVPPSNTDGLDRVFTIFKLDGMLGVLHVRLADSARLSGKHTAT